ncbi:MAG: translocation/assembly module TamB domain-containing protein [Candidatus Cloacimonadales bacterium]
MKKRKHKLLFTTSLILGILIISLILGYFLTQSSWFLNFARKTLITQVNKQIKGSIDITGLEGNMFKNLTFQDLVLYEGNSDSRGSEIVHLKELSLRYDLGQLIQKKVIVTSVSVSDLTVNLHQDAQGIWNLANIVPKADSTKIDTIKTEKKPNSWQIDLESLIVFNSQVNVSGENLPEQFPRKLLLSQLIAQASLREELNWKLSTAELTVLPHEITLSLKNLQGNDQPDVNLELLKISSPKSQIELTGNLINQPLRQAAINFKANPLDFSELQTWLPTFPLQGDPNFIGKLNLQGDSLASKITVNLDKQTIALQAQLPNIQNPLTANLDLEWENININSWQKDLPESQLNGNLLASIQGETWPEVAAQVKLKLQDSSFNSYEISTFVLESKGSPAHLKNNIQVTSEFGEVNTQADLENLLGDIGYAILGSLKELDIKKIVPTFPYQTEINSQFSLNGKGIGPQELNADFQVDLTGSSFENKPLDKLKLSGNYQRGNYLLNEMDVNYDGLDIIVRGKGNIYGNNELSYTLQLDSMPQIVQDLQPDIALKGTISGTAAGTLDNLTANARIDLQEMKYQDFQVASFEGSAEVSLINQKPEANFTGSVTKIEIPNLPMDSLWVNAHYTPEKVFLDLNLVQSDTLGLHLTGDIFPTLQQANFTKLEINAMGQNWKNKPDTLKINFNPNKLSLTNFALSSDTQIIVADFSLDSQESYDIHVKCDSLALWPLRYLNPALNTIEGKLSLNVTAKGDLNNPQLSISWDFDKPALQGISLHKITGSGDYQHNLAQFDLEVNRAEQENISLTGYLPFRIDIPNKEFELLKDEQLKLDLNMTTLDLIDLNEYTKDVEQVKGKLNLSAELKNTFNNPQLDAQLLVENVALKLPSLGIDYRNINLDFQAHNNILELKRLKVPSGKSGYLEIAGSTVLNLKEAQLDSILVSIKAVKWQVLKNRDMDLQIESDIEIAGNSNYPTFSGNLDILRARLYLPALMGGEKKKVQLTTPLLLVNADNNLADTTNPKEAKDPSQILKNLRGNLKLSFPRNIWLDSKEMNIELGGDVEILKNSPDFALSGNVTVVRGNYTLYGRRFNISSGEVYFQGESDLNPEINVVAEYTLRSSSQEKQTLSIQVTGRLQQPVIQFLLDDKQISEGDGVSYIVFGKSTAELSSGEKDQVDSSGKDNLATKILVNQIASRVTTALQNKLNLDVIEFKGDDNWRQAQVVVGKYLTNNLFLSYQRELSFGNNNEVVPEKITLEYEIMRRLYLQATQGGEESTGVDLIWKFKK